MEENANVTVRLKPPLRAGHIEEHPSALGATTLAQHEAHPAPCATKFAQQRHASGIFAKRLAPARHQPRFLGLFPSLGELFRVGVHVRSHKANFFAPRAQGRHNCETNGITKRPPRYKTLPTTTVAHPSRYETLPAREKTAVFAQNASAGRILYRSQSTEAEQGEFCTGHRELTPPTPIASQSPTPPVGQEVTLTWLTMRIGYDDADRLISYPDAHNLSR